MANKIKDPGLGNASIEGAKRMINADGTFNVLHKNKTKSLSEGYHYLVNVSWAYFFGLSFLVYVLINGLFAFVYLFVGIEQIIASSGNVYKDFLNAFFFSTQTFTTLGYGAMSPQGVGSGIVSSIEAFLGLLFFAFVTGLVYGRFSKPKASIRFTKHAVLRDFNITKAIMFRIVNNRKSIMINPRVVLTLSLSKKNNLGEYVNNFYALKLERNHITYLPTTWTIVHEIDDESPLFGISKEALIQQKGELLVMVSYYDESFNQEVHQMHSYLLKDLMVDYKFMKAYHYNNDGKMTLDYNAFDNIESLKS